MEAGDEFYWDADAQEYVDANGKPVSDDDLRKWILLLLLLIRDNVDKLTERLTAGTLTLEEWAAAIEQELAHLHTALAIVANGGLAQMDGGKWERLATRLDFEITKFRNFVLQIEEGTLSAAQIRARIRLYVNAGWKTFANTVREREIEAGINDEERRVLGGSNHCAVCPEIAGVWAPIGTLLPLGDTPCNVNCLCHFEFRNTASGEQDVDLGIAAD